MLSSIRLDTLYFQVRRLTFQFIENNNERKLRCIPSRKYLHEKAEESRHNETATYLMFIAGIIFFVCGLLATMYNADNLKWLTMLPYNLTSNPASFLGLTLTFSGISVSIYGVVVGIFYSRKRAFYIQQLYQAHSFAEKSVNIPKSKTRKKPNKNVNKALKNQLGRKLIFG